MSDVYLHYLEWRWGSLVPWTAMRDQGESAVAKARLCVSVQTPDKAKKIMESWDALSVASQALLSRELGLTGVQAENYSWGAPVSEGKGPSFLCYYSPALLKKHIGWKKPSAVEVLAEICRAGRMLYPLRIGADNTFTTIDLAMLKDVSFEDITSAGNSEDVWVLMRCSEKDARVQKQKVTKLPPPTDRPGSQPSQVVLQFSGAQKKVHRGVLRRQCWFCECC